MPKELDAQQEYQRLFGMITEQYPSRITLKTWVPPENLCIPRRPFKSSGFNLLENNNR
jgi:hypothetical protein